LAAIKPWQGKKAQEDDVINRATVKQWGTLWREDRGGQGRTWEDREASARSLLESDTIF